MAKKHQLEDLIFEMGIYPENITNVMDEEAIRELNKNLIEEDLKKTYRIAKRQGIESLLSETRTAITKENIHSLVDDRVNLRIGDPEISYKYLNLDEPDEKLYEMIFEKIKDETKKIIRDETKDIVVNNLVRLNTFAKKNNKKDLAELISDSLNLNLGYEQISTVYKLVLDDSKQYNELLGQVESFIIEKYAYKALEENNLDLNFNFKDKLIEKVMNEENTYYEGLYRLSVKHKHKKLNEFSRKKLILKALEEPRHNKDPLESKLTNLTELLGNFYWNDDGFPVEILDKIIELDHVTLYAAWCSSDHNRVFEKIDFNGILNYRKQFAMESSGPGYLKKKSLEAGDILFEKDPKKAFKIAINKYPNKDENMVVKYLLKLSEKEPEKAFKMSLKLNMSRKRYPFDTYHSIFDNYKNAKQTIEDNYVKANPLKAFEFAKNNLKDFEYHKDQKRVINSATEILADMDYQKVISLERDPDVDISVVKKAISKKINVEGKLEEEEFRIGFYHTDKGENFDELIELYLKNEKYEEYVSLDGIYSNDHKIEDQSIKDRVRLKLLDHYRNINFKSQLEYLEDGPERDEDVYHKIIQRKDKELAEEISSILINQAKLQNKQYSIRTAIRINNLAKVTEDANLIDESYNLLASLSGLKENELKEMYGFKK